MIFLGKYNIKLRRVQIKIEKSKFAPKLMKWHCLLQEGLIKLNRVQTYQITFLGWVDFLQVKG